MNSDLYLNYNTKHPFQIKTHTHRATIQLWYHGYSGDLYNFICCRFSTPVHGLYFEHNCHPLKTHKRTLSNKDTHTELLSSSGTCISSFVILFWESCMHSYKDMHIQHSKLVIYSYQDMYACKEMHIQHYIFILHIKICTYITLLIMCVRKIPVCNTSLTPFWESCIHTKICTIT